MNYITDYYKWTQGAWLSQDLTRILHGLTKQYPNDTQLGENVRHFFSVLESRPNEELVVFSEFRHPLTCCSHSTPECKRSLAYEQRNMGIDVPYTDENEGVLIPTADGWVCPCGVFKLKNRL
jgi:hypothetical protein